MIVCFNSASFERGEHEVIYINSARFLSGIVKGAALLGASAFVTPSAATVLPSPTYLESVDAYNLNNALQQNTSTSPGTQGVSVVGASAGAEAVPAANQLPLYANPASPGLSLVAASVAVNNGGGSAVANESYFMEILGPTSSVNVSVTYNAGVTSTGNVNPGNTAGFYLAVNPGSATPGNDVINPGNAIWAAQQVELTSSGLQLSSSSTNSSSTNPIGSLGQVPAPASNSQSATLLTNTMYEIHSRGLRKRIRYRGFFERLP